MKDPLPKDNAFSSRKSEPGCLTPGFEDIPVENLMDEPSFMGIVATGRPLNFISFIFQSRYILS